MGDSSISKLYQFIAANGGLNQIDKNNDGIITKIETFDYLKDEIKSWNGGESVKDIVSKFWDTLDFDREGKVKNGSKINDANALNDEEMQNFEKNAQICKRIDEFVQNFVSNNVPDVVKNNSTRWIASVKEGIIEKAFNYLSKNKNVSDITDDKLREFYELTYRKATADYYAAELRSNIKVTDKNGKQLYYPETDTKLKSVVNAYIQSLDGDTTTSLDTIISKVEEIIEAYKDTANTNSKTNVLTNYGYDTEGSLNDLQNVTLTKDITEKITNYISSNYSDLYTGDKYKVFADEVIKQYVEAYLSSKKASEFTSLKAFDISKIDINKLVQDIKDAQASTRTADEEAAQAAKDAQMTALQNDTNPFTIDGHAYSVSSILSMAGTVQFELCDDLKWDDQNVVSEAGKRINYFLNALANTLVASGFPSDTINKAKTTTYNYYMALIKASRNEDDDNDGRKSVFISYYDANTSKNVGVNTTFGYNADYDHADVNSIGDIRNSGDSGYYMGCNQERWARDQYCLYLDLKVVVNKFLSFIQ